MKAEGLEAGREGAASEAEAEASTRAAAREALGSAAGGYVPCEVPSLLRAGAVEPNSSVARST